jgi:hypothetical protein
VVMEKSLEEGYAKLKSLMAEEQAAIESRFPPLSSASEKMGKGGSSRVSSGEKSPGDETKKKN